MPNHTTRDRLLGIAAPAPEFEGMTIEEATRGQFERGFDIGAGSLRRGIFGAAQAAGEVAGIEPLAEFGEAGAQRAREEAATLPPLAQPRASQVDWTSFDDVADWVGGALGQATPSLAAAAGAGTLAAATGGGALPVLAAAGLTSAIPEAGSTFLDILEETGERRPGVAAATGLAAGALDALGAGRVARAAIPDSVIRELVRAGVDPGALQRLGLRQTGLNPLRRAGEAGLAEAGTEAAQGAVGDIGRTAGGIEGLDPLDIERRIDEAAIGLVAGGTVGGVPSAVSLGVERARDARTRQEGAQEPTEGVRQARRFTPEGEQRADFEVDPEGVARRSRRFDPTGRPFVDQPGSISDFQPPEGAVDLAEAPHIVEGGDTDIKYSRGLQGVERALAEGRIVLSDADLARVRQAAERARAALEDPERELTDQEIEDIKSGFAFPAVQAIFDRAKQIDEGIRSGRIDTSRGLEEAIDRPDVRFEPIPDDSDPAIQDTLTMQDVVQIEQNRYILPNQGNAPMVTAEAARAAADLNNVTDVEINDGLQKQIDKLNAKSKKEFYQRVPYSEVIESQARELYGSNLTPEALRDLKNSRATALFNEMSQEKEESGRTSRFSVLDLFDPQNPGAWLDNFGAIKQIGQEPSRQALDLPEEVFQVQRVTTEGGQFRGGENAVFKTVPRGSAYNPQASNIEATLNGRKVQLNLMNLINQARPVVTRERQDEGLPLYERVKRDFNTAISSLLNDPNNDVEIDFNAIPKNTVAFRTSDGIEFTYEQLTRNMTVNEQLENMRERIARVQRAIQLEQENIDAGGPANIQAEARQRLARFQRQERALLRNITGLETQLATEGREALFPRTQEEREAAEFERRAAREEEFEGEREVTGVIEQGQQRPLEEVRRQTATQRGFEEEPSDVGELRRSPQDVSREAAAAYEIIRRKGFLDGAPIKNFENWMDFVDQVYERAGLPPITRDPQEVRGPGVRIPGERGDRPRHLYNPKLVARTLRRAAGIGTPDPAIPETVLRRIAATPGEARAEAQRDALTGVGATSLIEMALGRQVTPQRPATVEDVQVAVEAHAEALAETATRRMRESLVRHSADIFGRKVSNEQLNDVVGGEANIESAFNDAVQRDPEILKQIITQDKQAVQTRQRLEKFVKDINKELNVEHPAGTLLNTGASVRLLLKSGATPVEVLMGDPAGLFDRTQLIKGGPGIVVNPFLDPITAAQVATHEYGHFLSLGTDMLPVSSNPDIKALREAMGAVDAEYRDYRDKVLSNFDLKVSDVIFSRQPPAMARNIVSQLGERGDVPFVSADRAFAAYFISRDEWLADRVAAQLSRAEGVDRVIQDYLDSFKNAYSNVIFGEYPQDNSSVAELFNLWLPSNAAIRAHADAFMRQQENDAPDTDVPFSRARQSTPAEDSPTYRQLSELVQRSLGVSLEQLAEAWVPDGQMSPRNVISKLLMLAETDMQMAESVLHNQMMRYALSKMLSPQEIQLLGNVATNDFVFRQIRERLAGKEEALALLNDPEVGVETAIAYAYQFSITDPSFRLGAAPRSIYQKVHRFLSDLLAIINESDSARLVFNAFHEGSRVNVAKANDAGGTFKAYEAHIFGPDAQIRESAVFKFERWYRRVDPIQPAQNKIQNFRNPVLSRLADQFQRAIGRTGLERTYFEERTAKTGEFMGRVHRIMNPLSETQLIELGGLVRNFSAENRRAADPAVRKAAEDIYLLMDDMFAYLKEAGVDIGPRGPEVQVQGRKVRAYFPWRFDPTAIMVNAGRLRDVLKRPEYAKQINKIVNKRIQQGLRDVTADTVIDSIMVSVLNAGGAADVQIADNVQDFAPGMDSFMKRELWWLMEDSDVDNPVSEDSKAQWAEAFDQNVYNTLENYIDQGVKRAAFTRRFGKKGSKLTAALLRAKEAGATDEELQYAQRYVQAMLGSYGRMTHLKLNTAINWASEKLGRGKIVPENPQELIDPKFAKFSQIMITYQNLRVLDFAVFTSLVDPAGIAARSGSLSNAWSSFRDGISAWRNHYWKNNEDYIASVGEMLGITEMHLTNEAIQQEYGGTWMSGRAQKMNDALFKYTGLSGWTRMTRLMAVASAMKFLKFHTQTPTDQSADFLSDLGLLDDDLDIDSFDAEGNVMLMDEGTRAQLQSTKIRGPNNELIDKPRQQLAQDRRLLARDDRLRTAIIRYTNEAILRPNAAQRPVWASDPHFALIFHLKQFMWSFTSVILANVAHQAKNGNYAPLMLAGTIYPLGMGAVDALRDWLRYGSEGAPSMRDATFSDYAYRAVQRSGLTGFAQLGIDAQKDIQYGGIGIEPFLGPTVGQAMDLLEVPASENKTLIDFIDRATPLQNTTKVLEYWAW